MDIAKHVIVLRTFMRDDLRHTSGTNDQNVLFQFSRNTFSEVEPIYAPHCPRISPQDYDRLCA